MNVNATYEIDPFRRLEDNLGQRLVVIAEQLDADDTAARARTRGGSTPKAGGCTLIVEEL